MQHKRHWDEVYLERGADQVSWYQERPEPSLGLIEDCGIGRRDAIVDIGGGASNLVDHLLAAGYTDLTVLDLSPAALALAQGRLGPDAERVRWIAADVTRHGFERRYALWHDRAVFHFLVTEEERERYREAVASALAPGGCLIVATFALDGPERCSGLPVQRYGAESLAAAMGPEFRLEDSRPHLHRTPKGVEQSFVFCRLRHVAA